MAKQGNRLQMRSPTMGGMQPQQFSQIGQRRNFPPAMQAKMASAHDLYGLNQGSPGVPARQSTLATVLHPSQSTQFWSKTAAAATRAVDCHVSNAKPYQLKGAAHGLAEFSPSILSLEGFSISTVSDKSPCPAA